MAPRRVRPDHRSGGFRRWVLVTRDAHGLYRQFGFAELGAPERYMEIRVPDAYGAEGPEKSRR